MRCAHSWFDRLTTNGITSHFLRRFVGVPPHPAQQEARRIDGGGEVDFDGQRLAFNLRDQEFGGQRGPDEAARTEAEHGVETILARYFIEAAAAEIAAGDRQGADQRQAVLGHRADADAARQ